ncbi:MAG: hypothetical protein F2740_02245 [Actinobacteria bacterium]|nr:hypothetical protein [Actinomycetota bacterium]
MISCKRCGYSTTLLSTLKRHLQRKKQCNPVVEDIETSILYNKCFEKDVKPYKCEYCDKSYTHISSTSYHKKTCVKKIEIELLQKQQLIIDQQKQIESLKAVLPANTINNANTNTNTNTNSHNTITNNNITINAFGKENIEYLKNNPNYKQIMMNCMAEKEHGVMKLLEYIYFNPDHPENQTVKKSIKKDNFIKLYDGKKWNLSFVDKGLSTILLKIEAEFVAFLDKMEDEGTRVKDPLMKRFMKSVGYALDFDFSALQHPPVDCDLEDKHLTKLKNDLHTLFIFFINEKTNEMTRESIRQYTMNNE